LHEPLDGMSFAAPALMAAVHVRFERGTLAFEGPGVGALPGVLWDARTAGHRAAAHRFGDVAADLAARGISLDGDLRAAWPRRARPAIDLELRTYQSQALAAWAAFGQRGVVVLPTGAGKTRLAIAAIAETGLPAAVLCPTRVLATAWRTELERWLAEPIGMIGDGDHRVERVTVMTFESAYRHMDAMGERFGLLVVDEVHHFGAGVRIEALEASAAVARLGLTATAPSRASPAAARIEEVVGPVVFELGFADLVGTHLAHVTVTRISVKLDDEERAAYDLGTRRFREMSRAFLRAYPGADYATLARALGESMDGRRALRDHGKAQELASFPRSKRRLVHELLTRHEPDRTIVFTAFAENAYCLARDNLVPVIAAETSARERQRILDLFREGRVRAVASARVLNEGVDIPDARVAIIVAGTRGPREHVQRIGRVLRPAPDKRALVYELVTADTLDERRARTRGRHAPGPVACISKAPA
jgi:superfamily II DNA or RNA helicase